MRSGYLARFAAPDHWAQRLCNQALMLYVEPWQLLWLLNHAQCPATADALPAAPVAGALHRNDRGGTCSMPLRIRFKTFGTRPCQTFAVHRIASALAAHDIVNAGIETFSCSGSSSSVVSAPPG